MKADTSAQIATKLLQGPRLDPRGYYHATQNDYTAWSAEGNMHFGYYEPGMDWFDREAQLQQMTTEVGRRLGLASEAENRIVDLGCGTGAPLRYLLNKNPGWHATGLTLAEQQVATARDLARQQGLNSRMTVLCEDIRQTSFPPRRFDGAIAMESFCYGTGFAKNDVLVESKRLLRPGARMVIADGFLHTMRALPDYLAMAHDKLCNSWQLDTLPCRTAVDQRLRELGFTAITWEDISMQVAPSLLQVPGVTSAYLMQLWRESERVDPFRWGHATAPMLAMLLGLARRYFGYYLLSATRG